MSMNYAEIDAVLAELDLVDGFIQQIWQPQFDTMILEIARAQTTIRVRLCLKSSLTRIHATTQNFPTKGVQARFANLLRARIKGGRIVNLSQPDQNRVVDWTIQNGEATYHFLVRLWGSSANAFLCQTDNEIIDCWYRRPARGEMSGGQYLLPPVAPAPKIMGVRPHDGDLNAFLDRAYAVLETTTTRDALKAQLSARITQIDRRLQSRLSGLEHQANNTEDADRFQLFGQLILANQHRLRGGESEIDCEDWTQPGTEISIPLSPPLSPSANAERWFQKSRKARESRGWIANSIRHCQSQLEQLSGIQEQFGAAKELQELYQIQAALKELEPQRQKLEEAEEGVGVRFHILGYDLIVGRNAAENDALLRRQARGNDLWFHARDYAGSYVFLRPQKNKSVPLDLLLDAAHLAIWYSKGKQAPAADVYYTAVKYLRRAKDGPRGLVIPTQEKNLHIKVDSNRLDRILKPRAGEFADL